MYTSNSLRSFDRESSYLSHVAETLGIAGWMMVGAVCSIVHAVLPFAFARTGPSIVSHLNSRMLANRRRRVCPPELQDGGRFTLADH